MRTKQAMKNTITSILLQLVAVVPGIIIPKLFTELYGSPVSGLVNSIGQFITYMGLVEAGIGAAGTVALYRPLADNDIGNINGVISAARAFYRRSGMIFVFLIGGLVAFYPFLVQGEINDAGFVRMMIVVLSLNGVVDYFFLGKYRVLLMADQRGYVISVAQIIGTVVMTVLSILLIELKCSAIAVKAVAAAVYILRSLVVAIYVRRHYGHLNFRAKPNMGALGQRWDALLHQVVGMVVCNTDVVLLTLLLKVNKLLEVNVYGVYNMVTYALSNVMNAFTNGLTSGFGQVISKNEKDVLRRSFSTYEYAFFLVVFIVYSCLAVLLHPFIHLYTANFSDAATYLRWPLVALFTLSGLLQSLRLPGLTIICAAGHYRQTRMRAIWEAVINLGASLLLIGPFGINGVLIGTCASYCYRSTDIILYTAKHFLPGTLRKTAGRLARNLIAAGGMTAVGMWLIPQWTHSWGSWVLSALVFGIVDCTVIAGVNLLFEPAEFRELLGRAKEILLRKKSNA